MRAATVPSAARLVIPRLHLDDSVGTNLSSGPAFYPRTGRPGGSSTIAIAGHRTTHTHPFWSLDELRAGDRIVLRWRGRSYRFRVTGARVVAPTDWGAVGEVGHERLVLSTCTPRFSAAKRLIVYAQPVRSA